MASLGASIHESQAESGMTALLTQTGGFAIEQNVVASDGISAAVPARVDGFWEAAPLSSIGATEIRTVRASEHSIIRRFSRDSSRKEPAWSPEGRTIASVSGGSLGLHNALILDAAESIPWSELRDSLPSKPVLADEAKVRRAIDRGDTMMLQRLIESGLPEILSLDEGELSPMEYAIFRNSSASVRQLLDSGVSPESHPASCSCSPLSYAAINGRPRIIRMLARHGAAYDFPDACGFTPLELAANEGHAKSVKALIRLGARVRDRYALYYAVQHGYHDVVQLLLDAGADPARSPYFPYGSPFEHVILTKGGDSVLIDNLLRHGANPNARASTGQPLLWYAANAGSFEAVRLLLEHGADPNMRTPDNMTPLSCTTDERCRELLIAAGGYESPVRQIEVRRDPPEDRWAAYRDPITNYLAYLIFTSIVTLMVARIVRLSI